MGREKSGSGPSHQKTKRGRPVDLAKRQAILAAAENAFFSAALRKLNIEAIARAAGVSKATVYAQFGSLMGVLRAVIEQHRDHMASALRTLPQSGDDVRTSLVAFGEALLDFLVSPQATALQRMLASSVAARARLGRLVFAEGPLVLRRRVAAILANEQRQGRLRQEDPELIAEQLLGMWQGLLVSGLVMGGCTRPTKAEIQRRVRTAVDALLRAYGQQGGATTPRRRCEARSERRSEKGEG